MERLVLKEPCAEFKNANSRKPSECSKANCIERVSINDQCYECHIKLLNKYWVCKTCGYLNQANQPMCQRGRKLLVQKKISPGIEGAHHDAVGLEWGDQVSVECRGIEQVDELFEALNAYDFLGQSVVSDCECGKAEAVGVKFACLGDESLRKIFVEERGLVVESG